MTEEVGKVLQGGATLTIPRKQLNHHAFFPTVDLSGNIDLSTNKNIKLSIDGGSAVQIDVSSGAVDTSAVTLEEAVAAINGAGLGEIAYEGSIDGNPNGSDYIIIRSLKVGSGSRVDILIPGTLDATPALFGLASTQYPKQIIPDVKTYAFLPLYNKVSRGDVFTVEDRLRRDGDLLRKGVRDTIHAFDVQRILSVSIRGTVYKESIDFTHSNRVITWLGNGSPADDTDYTVEHLCRQNYIVYDELASDRGSDTDFVAKRIHLALRTYAAETALPIS